MPAINGAKAALAPADQRGFGRNGTNDIGIFATTGIALVEAYDLGTPGANEAD
jgi:hypothetical protein